jgi:hypothetical protein
MSSFDSKRVIELVAYQQKRIGSITRFSMKIYENNRKTQEMSKQCL